MKALNYIFKTMAVAAAVTLTSCETLLMTSGTTTVGYDTYGGAYDTYGYGAGSSWRSTGTSVFAYDRARAEALFLSDKMAYELGLSDAQFEAVYEINLDYLLNIANYDALYSTFWARRNSDLFYVLNARQYNYYMSAEYFYRPVTWYNNAYAFSIYDRYYDRSYYYRPRPTIYDSYRGGHNQSAASYYQGRFGERHGNPPTVTNRTTTTQPTTTPRSYGNGTRQTQTGFGSQGGTQNRTQTGTQNPQPKSNSTTFGSGARTTTQPSSTSAPQQKTVTEQQRSTTTQKSESSATESKKFGGRR